jgi:hypothetical protein
VAHFVSRATLLLIDGRALCTLAESIEPHEIALVEVPDEGLMIQARSSTRRSPGAHLEQFGLQGSDGAGRRHRFEES